MSALGHYLEAAGLATTGISLVREHSEQMRPPRTLWVPFELGRPLGVPGDAAFQHRVILAALKLLRATSGPVLADYEEEAPPIDEHSAGGWACPVSFAAPLANDNELPAAVSAEVQALAPWYELSVRTRERTTVGGSGVSPMDAAQLIASFRSDVECGSGGGERLRHAIEDLKAYYLEAATARPGQASSRALSDWLWGETALADLLKAVAKACSESKDEGLRRIATSALVPRAHSE